MARRVVWDLFHHEGNNTLYGDNASRGDEILGGDGDDKLFGLDGSDLLSGGKNNDLLWGGNGNDFVYGGSGDDMIFIDRGNNTFDGGSGDNDALDFRAVRVIEGFFGASHSFEEAVVGFKVDLETGQTFASTLGNDVYTDDYGTNAFTSIERYIMTGQADIMRGDDTGDVFEMSGGDDFVEGRGGADRLFGDAGVDTASYESSSAGVDVDLTRSAQIGGDAEGDELLLIENLKGSANSDRLFGNNGNNLIDGGGGSDDIAGGGGRDTLRGGSGADAFIFEEVSESNGNFDHRDLIEDFGRFIVDFTGRRVPGDKIDLAAIDADQRSGRVGNQEFDFVGSEAFTGVGQVRVVQAQDTEGRNFSFVQAEVNGDGIADFQISVFTTNNTLLTASDFIF